MFFKIITRKRLFQDLLFWWELILIYFEIDSKQTQICSLEQLNCFLNSLSWFYILAIFITRWFDPSWRLMIPRKCLGDFVFSLTSFNWRSNSLSSSFKVLHNSSLKVKNFGFFSLVFVELPVTFLQKLYEKLLFVQFCVSTDYYFSRLCYGTHGTDGAKRVHKISQLCF